jgi:beta-1,4-N-acetylglucosaminyltransferase
MKFVSFDMHQAFDRMPRAARATSPTNSAHGVLRRFPRSGQLRRRRRLVRPVGPASTRLSREHADVILVCSSGGHLQEMLALEPVWSAYSRVWVTFDKSDARSLLRDERVVYAYSPTNRNVKNLLRNHVLAWRTLRVVGPRVLLTTGAGVAVPFAWVGRLLRVRIVYVESFARITGPSLTGRLVAPIAHRAYVQWPEMEGRLAKARYVGNVFARP